MVKAVAVLRGDSNVKGTVTFEQASEDSNTIVSWNITGNDPNAQRGFHVHEFGDNTNGCISAGPHFNPEKVTHGDPDSDDRHVGDLGNVSTDASGNAVGSREDKFIKLIGPKSVVGRTIVIHGGVDDLGKLTEDVAKQQASAQFAGDEAKVSARVQELLAETKKTGNAGARNACGVIGIAA
ncbi:Cu,Zn superoxide dismutase [Ascobolus immersus RN42]|uniref:Superoxide dismutase [Cu-Zn] n=1 Tax=Ascobolus immersus RN42 TaxID=1160509 RepID=A0A3N4HKS4_ASCIM|nr:Cu,Zn superoxide dismutase [Ascobolus immersus RN42]